MSLRPPAHLTMASKDPAGNSIIRLNIAMVVIITMAVSLRSAARLRSKAPFAADELVGSRKCCLLLRFHGPAPLGYGSAYIVPRLG